MQALQHHICGRWRLVASRFCCCRWQYQKCQVPQTPGEPTTIHACALTNQTQHLHRVAVQSRPCMFASAVCCVKALDISVQQCIFGMQQSTDAVGATPQTAMQATTHDCHGSRRAAAPPAPAQHQHQRPLCPGSCPFNSHCHWTVRTCKGQSVAAAAARVWESWRATQQQWCWQHDHV